MYRNNCKSCTTHTWIFITTLRSKSSPQNRPLRPTGARSIAYSFFNLGADGVGDQRHAPVALPSGKRPGLYRRVGGPRGRSGRLRKISSPPGFDPRTVQPAASRYTVTSSCHRLHYKSLALIWTPPTVREQRTWTSPEKQPTQWVFKLLFANSLIWSENGFIRTLTHTHTHTKMQYGISKLIREPPPAYVGGSGQSTHPSHTAAL